LLAVVLGILLCCGCAGGKGAVREAPPPTVRTGPGVAVAPMDNRSNDLDASEIIRGAFVSQIEAQGWNVMPTAESDPLLRDTLGISYGGQLKASTPEEVCRALKVEGVFYGEVQEWNKTTIGLYNSLSVIATFKLYRTDGALAWEESDRQFQMHVPRGGGREIGGEIIGHALANLLLKPMTPVGKTVGRNLAVKLPSRALMKAEIPCHKDNSVPPGGLPDNTSIIGEETGGSK
jgi:hypothetical protein